MHISTFYSFKGGVGRTLALVNVATELARSKRKVLVVDFDLEAPGIDTFTELQSEPGQQGIVDYVADYMQSGRPPSIERFLYMAPGSNTEEIPGELWVMPSGQRRTQYGATLASINWQTLYGEMEGFLLFEELKSQWESHLKPDYVLIDSRTGFTEVGGICTRQLPDMVVILFMPNEQNLLGLKPVVDAIRGENEGPAAKEITIEFVASNVPVLDDEEDILRKLMQRFGKAFRSPTDSAESARTGSPIRFLTIERYDSLQLLEQSIFVVQRPKSRLAKQYRNVMRSIVDNNLGDREGAIEFLKKCVSQRKSRYADTTKSEERIPRILQRHSSDAEVLMWAGRFYKELPNTQEAISLFQQSLTTAHGVENFPRCQVLIDLAESWLAEQQPDDAFAQMELALNDPGLDAAVLRRIVHVWRQSKSEPIRGIASLPSVSSFDDQDILNLVSAMDISRAWQSVALDLLVPRINQAASGDDKRNLKELMHRALLAGIGARRFDVIPQFVDYSLKKPDPDLPELFNGAMGRWALNKSPERADFERVIEREPKHHTELPDANFLQCLGLSHAVIGDVEQAMLRLGEARRINDSLQVNRFSCWRYLEISATDFRDDLDEIERFLKGEKLSPRFLRAEG